MGSYPDRRNEKSRRYEDDTDERSNGLRQIFAVRVILLVVGFITSGANLYFFTQGKAAVWAQQLFLVFTGVGVVFIGFGIFVKRFPVPITITAFIIYVTCHAVMGVVVPGAIFSGLFIKIPIVAALAGSIPAAFAFERERRKTRRRPRRGEDDAEPDEIDAPSRRRDRPVRQAREELVDLDCPKCGELFALPSREVGDRVRCTHCRKVFDVEVPFASARDEEEEVVTRPRRDRRRERDERDESTGIGRWVIPILGVVVLIGVIIVVIYSVKLGRKEKELANVFIPQQHVPVVNVPELPPPILKEPAKTPKKIELNFDPRLGPLPVDAIAQIPLPEDIGEVIALRFSDDGKTLACGTQLEHACWIDVDKRKVIGVAPEAPKTQPFGNDVRTVSAISPDTTKVAVFPPHGRLSYFNRAESIEPIVLSKDSPNQPKIWNTAFSSDGKRLCSTHDDKTAQIWDVDKKAMIEKLDGYEDRVDAAAWSPDGSLLATTASNQVVIHDARTFNRLATLEVPKNEFPYFLDFDRNGKLLAAVYRQAVYFWPLERNGDQLEVGKRRDFRQVAQVKQIAFSPDGKFFISADSAGRVALRDIQTFEVKEDFFRDQRIVGYDRRGACAFRKQDGLLAVADLHRVVLFDLKTLRKK